ncbi:MAG: type II secretion system minor pseudopilin GspI [Sedimenticola sp.]
MNADRSKGFTLLEVLVALAVVVISMSALVKSAGENAANQAYLESRTFASWLAANRLNLLQLGESAAIPGSQEGEEILAGREWHWRLKTSTTGDPRVLRAEIEVSPAEYPQTVEARMIGFVGVEQ